MKFDIDHIRALSNGGTNEKSNLQPLCKACHMVKTSSEHETGQYIKIIDTESTFNTQVHESGKTSRRLTSFKEDAVHGLGAV
jgi:hypothetical protein